MPLFASLPGEDEKSYSPLWKVVPAVLVLLLFAYHQAGKAAGEKDTAGRQETAFGNVLDCKTGGKGGQYCHYIFHAVDEQSYLGESRASSDIAMGQTVNVFYDSRNPRINALESFSVQSRDDQSWVYIFLLVTAASIGIGFYARENLHSDR